MLEASVLVSSFFFLKNTVNKTRAIVKHINSDIAVLIQIPLPPNKEVRITKLNVTSTKLLPKEMIVEDIGFSIATKKPEIIKLNPKNKKVKEYCLNTDIVEVNNSTSLGFINKDVILLANNWQIINTDIEVIRTVFNPILNKDITFLSSLAPKL